MWHFLRPEGVVRRSVRHRLVVDVLRIARSAIASSLRQLQEPRGGCPRPRDRGRDRAPLDPTTTSPSPTPAARTTSPLASAGQPGRAAQSSLMRLSSGTPSLAKFRTPLVYRMRTPAPGATHVRRGGGGAPLAPRMLRRPRRHCALAARWSTAVGALPARGWNAVGGEQCAGCSRMARGIGPGSFPGVELFVSRSKRASSGRLGHADAPPMRVRARRSELRCVGRWQNTNLPTACAASSVRRHSAVPLRGMGGAKGSAPSSAPPHLPLGFAGHCNASKFTAQARTPDASPSTQCRSCGGDRGRHAALAVHVLQLKDPSVAIHQRFP